MSVVGQSVVHFSDHFNLGLLQSDLDFVDVPLNTDVPLFVDPFAFKIRDDDWTVECNNLLIDFFQHVLDAIRNGNDSTALELLSNTGEPNEARLGLSRGLPAGRGMGGTFNNELLQRLRGSKAVRTGKLRDLTECELMVPHVSHDRISDITINVTWSKLAEFTLEQCKKYGIQTKQIAGRSGWCSEIEFWKADYCRLPVYKNEPIVLVPKAIVRRKGTFDHQEYWRQFCIEHMRQEHLSSNSSLCRTLKDGTRIPPTIKSLAAILRCDKNELLAFSEKHPNVLKEYKERALQRRPELSDYDLACLLYGQFDTRTTIIINNSGGTVNTVSGHNIGGVVGSGVVNARDIKAFTNHVNTMIKDSAVKNLLLKAREELEQLKLPHDQGSDAADALGKITAEFEKDQPNKSVVTRWVEFLKNLAPPVHHLLSCAKIIHDLSS